MQAEIRGADDPSFIQKPYFEELKLTDQLLSVDHVAQYLFKVFTQTSNQEFSEQEWDIRLHPLDQ